MSQTAPSNPNLQDNEELLSLSEEGQFWSQTRSTPIPGEFGEVEMIGEPKLVFPGKASRSVAGKQTDPQQAQQLRYRQGGGMWSNLPLRTKVVAIATVLGILPASVLGMVNYSLQSNTLSQQLEIAAAQSATHVNDQLALFMRERFGDIQIMAKVDLFTNAEERANATVAQRQAVLDRFIAAYPVYNSIAVFDLAGNPIGNSGGDTIGNHADRSYFKAALAADGPVISQHWHL
jgi:hypothetical protein